LVESGLAARLPAASWCVGAAFLLALGATPASRAAEPPGAATPEALVARLRAAAQHDDLAEVANCTAPDQRRVWAAAMLRKGDVMMTMLGVEDGAAGAAAQGATPAQQVEAFKARPERIAVPAELGAFYQAILEKHGIAARLAKGGAPRDDAATAKLLEGVDEGALIADLTALIDSLLDPSRREHPTYFPDTEVGPFEVKGDRAKAKCGDCQVELVRVGGRWYHLLPPKDKD
jgi:hypothetical protein